MSENYIHTCLCLQYMWVSYCYFISTNFWTGSGRQSIDLAGACCVFSPQRVWSRQTGSARIR